MKKPIQTWIDEHPIDAELIYGKAGIDQAIFFRDKLSSCIARTYEEFETCAYVIGEHTSKSVRLPVVLFERPNLSVVVRDNFHNVAISVKRSKRLNSERKIVERLIEYGTK